MAMLNNQMVIDSHNVQGPHLAGLRKGLGLQRALLADRRGGPPGWETALAPARGCLAMKKIAVSHRKIWENHRKTIGNGGTYPLVNVYIIAMENHHAINGKINQ